MTKHIQWNAAGTHMKWRSGHILWSEPGDKCCCITLACNCYGLPYLGVADSLLPDAGSGAAAFKQTIVISGWTGSIGCCPDIDGTYIFRSDTTPTFSTGMSYQCFNNSAVFGCGGRDGATDCGFTGEFTIVTAYLVRISGVPKWRVEVQRQTTASVREGYSWLSPSLSFDSGSSCYRALGTFTCSFEGSSSSGIPQCTGHPSTVSLTVASL